MASIENLSAEQFSVYFNILCDILSPVIGFIATVA